LSGLASCPDKENDSCGSYADSSNYSGQPPAIIGTIELPVAETTQQCRYSTETKEHKSKTAISGFHLYLSSSRRNNTDCAAGCQDLIWKEVEKPPRLEWPIRVFISGSSMIAL